jgi:hypothetical protein
MDDDKWEEELSLTPEAAMFRRIVKRIEKMREERRKRSAEIVESLSDKYPELSRILKDLLPKRLVVETTKDGGIVLSRPVDIYDQGYSIKFKCRERTCKVRGVLETAGDPWSMKEFREEMRKYGCKVLSSEICVEEYCTASVRVRCSMSVDKFVEFVDKVLKRYH